MSASRRGVRAENAPIVEGADLVLDLGGVNLNDITTAAYSGHLDLSRFITVGLDDVRIGDQVIANVRLADVLSELAKLKPSSAPYRGTPQALAQVNGSASDKITMAALYPRYAAFLRAGGAAVAHACHAIGAGCGWLRCLANAPHHPEGRHKPLEDGCRYALATRGRGGRLSSAPLRSAPVKQLPLEADHARRILCK